MNLKRNIISVGMTFSMLILLTYDVSLVGAKGSTDVGYHCEKYCDVNCDDIAANKPEKEECKAVHSQNSDCNCHFGGISFGIFLALGLALVLVLTCCACRFCRSHEAGINTTNILVVTQPETVTTITHQGTTDYTNQHSQKQVYSIEMVPQASYHASPVKVSPSPPPTEQIVNITEHLETSGITVIMSRKRTKEEPTSLEDPRTPSSISDRIFFQDSGANEDESEDPMFLPPRY